ncbi:MATE family efflux transporter [Bacillus sp. SL00103]
MNFAIGGFIIIIVYLFAPQILSIFLTDSKTIDIAYSLVVITLWSYLIFWNSPNCCRHDESKRTVLWPTIFSICSIWLVEVLSCLCVIALHIPWYQGHMDWLPCGFLVNLLLQYGYYQLVWKKKQIVALVQS